MKTIGDLTLNDINKICSEGWCGACPLSKKSFHDEYMGQDVSICLDLFGSRLPSDFDPNVLNKEAQETEALPM